MEKVPKLRFKEFSGEWEEKKLENLCNNFIVPMRDKPKNLEGIIPWCRIEDFEGKYLLKSKSNQGVSIETVKEMNLKVFPIDTLLVSCSANLGRCAIIKKELITNQTFIGLVPKKDKINIEYFYYLMLLQERKLNLISSGTTISYLSKDEFKNFKILLSLNLQEQQKIADFLSSVDRKISIIEEKLNLFKEYKKGMMQKIFSQKIRFKDSEGNDYPEWEEKRLGDITKNISSGKTLNKMNIGKYNLYGSTGKIGFTNDIDYCGENILIARVGANAGTLNFISEECGITDNTLVTSVKNNNCNKWLYYYLISYNLNRLIFGSGQPLITGSLLKKIYLSIPCLEEQEKIADFLSSIDNKIDNLASELENLKEFKKGLLQQMFV